MIFNIIDKVKRIMKELKDSSNPKSSSSRSNLERNFLKKDDSKLNDFIAKKNQSMNDSQGVSDFSGSGYNGPGNVDREKTNSNMGQRNFER